jgi:tRNA G37 N-methylase Trm5
MTHSLLVPFMDMTRSRIGAALASARSTGTPFFVVDATAGNGHDSLFLAREAGTTGHVFAFDVQENAITNAQKRVEDAGLEKRVTFIHAGHETAEKLLPPETEGNLWAATFNLGFLPGSDKSIVTEATATITALGTLTKFAAPGCVVSVHTYRGHKGGENEFRIVSAWLQNLPWEVWRVAEYSFINKIKNKETLFLLEKAQTLAKRLRD